MNDRNPMDVRDDWLLNLYDGFGEVSLPEDPELAQEAASFRQMKGLLDRRPRRKPDPRTVGAVIAAARGEKDPRGVRRDRPPARRHLALGLRVGAVSTALVALIALVGILQPDGSSTDAPPALPEAMETPAFERSEGESSDVTAQSASRRGTPDVIGEGSDAGLNTEAGPAAVNGRSLADGWADPGGGMLRAHPTAAGVLRADPTLAGVPRADPSWAAVFSDDPAPDGPITNDLTWNDPTLDDLSRIGRTWHEREAVIELHQRIDRIARGVEGGWETPSVPLEMLPDGSGTGIVPVGQTR